MTAILEIDAVERLAVVQPGVVNDDLRAACAEHGLWYPPDPASAPWSTIGGNVATNAGGLCCVKYGVTRDYVLELEVVTGPGEVVRLGRRTAKGVAGYDLVGLMVGSEGTLGRRHRGHRAAAPRPGAGAHRRRVLRQLVDAGGPSRRSAAAGVVPSALELVDRHCLQAVDDWKNMGLEADARRRPARPRRHARRGGRRRGRRHAGAASRRPARRGAPARPTRTRPRRCSPPAGWPTRPLERLGPGADRGRLRAPVAGAGDARPDRGDRRAARRADRQHRARRRRQPAPADHHPARRRGGAGARPGRVRRDHRPTRSRSAARSPASTASACSSATGSRHELCPEVVGHAAGGQGAHSTRTASSTRARSL